ncbi:hypothetical protein CONCODRAFT_170065 [Conidiobolus coronatus NRRL 28638]|uniref:Uncharacterized protein n=1 Tax=Conidiobolus coronatus (strain ATCC 28846 / CBS 209.66 / NRRL 28638) TaxID=796925 RepID=A0A137NQB2_CONC2|nr:hypothetical protein CONCODRAFT_170065 [Conidiobolus coronatus NRRL 28638]|eukprot:KXN64937.1 hypothetical protein CONCODRAFT_170065 [Conidiobolus coronatus NRRL 28638]
MKHQLVSSILIACISSALIELGDQLPKDKPNRDAILLRVGDVNVLDALGPDNGAIANLLINEEAPRRDGGGKPSKGDDNDDNSNEDDDSGDNDTGNDDTNDYTEDDTPDEDTDDYKDDDDKYDNDDYEEHDNYGKGYGNMQLWRLL